MMLKALLKPSRSLSKTFALRPLLISRRQPFSQAPSDPPSEQGEHTPPQQQKEAKPKLFGKQKQKPQQRNQP